MRVSRLSEGHSMNRARTFRRDFAIVLASGFRDHTVVITLDGREAYRRANVRTSAATLEADTFVAVDEWPQVHIVARVTPGDLVISADCDLRAHTRVVISLIGKGSVSLEMDRGFNGGLRRPTRAGSPSTSSAMRARPTERLGAG